jgi:hypothetical protein
MRIESSHTEVPAKERARQGVVQWELRAFSQFWRDEALDFHDTMMPLNGVL